MSSVRRVNFRDSLVYVAAFPLVPMALRLRMLASRGNRFEPWSRVEHGTIVLGSGLRLGRDAYVNTQCLIDATDRVTIGSEVHLGSRVQVVTVTHDFGPADRRAGDRITGPVQIEDGCWIGAGALILPGVTVVRGSIIAAGSVVSKSVPPDVLAGGVPARTIRQLDMDRTPHV